MEWNLLELLREDKHKVNLSKCGPQKGFWCQGWALGACRDDAANLSCNITRITIETIREGNKNLTFLLKESINSYLGDYLSYLWLINVLSLKFFKVGNWSLSRKSGFASINFFSTASTIALADLVSPYLDSCSFSLKKTNVCMKLHISELSYKSHFLWIQHIQKSRKYKKIWKIFTLKQTKPYFKQKSIE